LGAGYRFYRDSWSLTSHTVMADVAAATSERWLVALRYRFYTQNAASFYRSSYPTLDPAQRFYTNDKELSPLATHRLALDLEHSMMVSTRGQLLRATLSVAGSTYRFDDFIPLDSIRALEITLGVTGEL
jgi:hypothetical protein